MLNRHMMIKRIVRYSGSANVVDKIKRELGAGLPGRSFLHDVDTLTRKADEGQLRRALEIVEANRG